MPWGTELFVHRCSLPLTWPWFPDYNRLSSHLVRRKFYCYFFYIPTWFPNTLCEACQIKWLIIHINMLLFLSTIELLIWRVNCQVWKFSLIVFIYIYDKVNTISLLFYSTEILLSPFLFLPFFLPSFIFSYFFFSSYFHSLLLLFYYFNQLLYCFLEN